MRTLAVVGSLAAALAGCVQTPTSECGGVICPPGTRCSLELSACFDPADFDACVGLTEGDDCSVDSDMGTCRSGVCDIASCGDGFVSGLEQCDGEDVGGSSCASLGFYDGTDVSCTDSCSFDTALCSGACGDGELNGPELCDGAAPPALSCLSLENFDFGALACSSICGIDSADCRTIGFKPVASGNGLGGAWLGGPQLGYITGPRLLRIENGQWVFVDDVGTCTSYASVWGRAADDVYVACSGPTAMVYDGATWASEPTPESLRGLHGSEARGPVGRRTNTVYERLAANDWITLDGAGAPTIVRDHFVTADGIVFVASIAGDIYMHNGVSWTTENVGTAIDLTAIGGLASDYVVAGADDGSLFIREAGVWSTLGPLQLRPVNDIYVLPSGDFYYTDTTNAGVGRVMYYDGEALARFEFRASLVEGYGGHDLLALSPNTSMQVGSEGVASRFTGMATGQQLASGNAGLNGADAFSHDRILVVGSVGQVAMFDGRSWSVTNLAGDGGGSFASPVLSDVWFRERDHAFIVGDRGLTAEWDGSVWVEGDVGNTPFSTVGGAPGELPYAIDSTGVVYRNQGLNSWTVVDTGPVDTSGLVFLDIDASAPDNVYAIGRPPNTSAVAVLRFDGASWSLDTTSLEADGPARSIYVGDENNVFATTGSLGTLWHFDGTAWSEVSVPGSGVVQSVDGSASDDVFVGTELPAGDRGHFHWNGTSWAPFQVPTAGVDLAATARAVVFVNNETGGTVPIQGRGDVRLLLRPPPAP